MEVYATVTGEDGRAVKGLSASDFVILENDVPQKITAFVDGDFPAAVALGIDRSFSMAGPPLTMARTAGRAFVGSLKPDDRAMLVSISGEVEVLAPLSTDKGPLLKALDALDAWSTTSLNDALIRALDLLEGETGRRAIVVLSDGEDRYSQRDRGRRRRTRQAIGRPHVPDRDRQGPAGALSGTGQRHRRTIVCLETAEKSAVDAADHRRRPAGAIPHRVRAQGRG